MQTQEKLTKEGADQSGAAKPAARSFKSTVLRSLQSVTPARLGLLIFGNFSLIAFFCYISVSTVQQHDHAVKTVGIDAAPSVIAAYEIKSAVAAMDTDLASELLYEPGQPDAHDMQVEFDKWRSLACRQLVAAAKNITYGNAEQTPIEDIQIALGKYEMQAQAARDAHRAKNESEAIKYYCAAYDTVQKELLPNADKLEKADTDVLESTYSQEKAATNISRSFVLLMGLILICVLLYTQAYLLARFHRILCPPILLAIVCVVFIVNSLTAALGANSKALKVAKEDAYDSVLALLNARANAFNAAASTNRLLLDREHADAHEKNFFDSVNAVAKFEDGHNFTETIERADKQLKSCDKLNLPGFSGSLAKELSNIRFPEEGVAALEALRQFSAYRELDNEVKKLEKSGAHAEAVHLSLSYTPTGAKYPFSKFDDALMRTREINQVQMEGKIKEAFESLRGVEWETEAICFLAVICVYLGLLPRMEEYFHCEPAHKDSKVPHA